MGRKKRDLTEKFWERVDADQPEDQCWLWKSFTDPNGYGQLRWKEGKTARYEAAHRFSYKLHNPGVDIAGQILLHSCDNPPCVNPKHVRPGTYDDNVKDAMAKGRHIRGTRVATCKLSEPEVLEIISLYKSGLSKIQLSEKFSVSRTTISKILSGKQWSYLTKDILI